MPPFNGRAKLAPEKLRRADFVHNLPKIMAVAQNYGNCQESRHTLKITVFTAIMIPWFSYSPTDGASQSNRR